MTKNMGTADRAIRIAVALIVGVLYGMKIVSGTLGLVLIILAAVFLVTSFVGWCPLYTPLGLSTCKKTAGS